MDMMNCRDILRHLLGEDDEMDCDCECECGFASQWAATRYELAQRRAADAAAARARRALAHEQEEIES